MVKSINKPPKPKICPICSTEYIPRSSLQKVCHNYKCAIAFNKQRDAEISAREQRRRDKKERMEWTRRKADARPLSHWIKMTQRVFNDWIRLRDGNICISCGSTTAVSYHAGHYRTTAAAPQLRFNEDNVHSQCSACNVHKSGAITPYRAALIEKIGIERVVALEKNNASKKYTPEILAEIRKTYRRKIKEILNEEEETHCLARTKVS